MTKQKDADLFHEIALDLEDSDGMFVRILAETIAKREGLPMEQALKEARQMQRESTLEIVREEPKPN